MKSLLQILIPSIFALLALIATARKTSSIQTQQKMISFDFKSGAFEVLLKYLKFLIYYFQEWTIYIWIF